MLFCFSLSIEKDGLEASIASLKDRYDELSQQYQEAMEELQAQAGARISAEGDLNLIIAQTRKDLEDALNALAAERTLNDLTKDDAASTRSYTQRIEDLESKLDASHKDSEKAQSDCEYLQRKLDEISKQLSSQLEENMRKDSEINGLSIDNNENKNAAEASKVKANNALLELKQLQGAYDSLKSSLDEAVQTNAQLQLDLDSNRDNLHNAEAAATEATAKLAGLEISYGSIMSKVGILESDYTSRGEELDYLKGQLAIAELDANTKSHNLQHLLDEALHALTAEKTANDLAVDENASLSLELKVARDELNRLMIAPGENLGGANNQSSIESHLHDEISRLQAKLTGTLDTLSKRDLEAAEMNRKVEKLSSDLVSSERVSANLEKTLKDKDVELMEMREALEKSEAEMTKAHDDLHTALDKAAKADAENEAAQSRAKSASTSFSEAQASIDTMKKTLEEMINQDKSKLLELQEYKRALNGKENEIENLSNEIKMMTDNEASLKEEFMVSEQLLKEAKDNQWHLEHDLSEQNEVMKTLNARLKTLEAEHSNKGAEIDLLRGEMASQEAKLRAEVDKKDKDLTDAQNKLKAEQSARNSLEDQLSSTKASLEEILPKFEQRGHALETANTKLDGLSNRVAQHEEDLTDKTLALDKSKVGIYL